MRPATINFSTPHAHGGYTGRNVVVCSVHAAGAVRMAQRGGREGVRHRQREGATDSVGRQERTEPAIVMYRMIHATLRTVARGAMRRELYVWLGSGCSGLGCASEGWVKNVRGLCCARIVC